MNNIFYEFLEKNNLQDVILDIPINENFNLPFVDKKALQPLRIDLVMYPVKINNVIYNCYISSVPKPILYFTLKKSKAILDITTQEQILQALVSVVNKTLVKDKDYIIVKSPKTLPPTGKGSIVGDAISWKKGVWQFIRMAIEKGSKTNVQSDVKIDVKTSASAGSTGSTASSDSSSGQFDAKVVTTYSKGMIGGFEVLSDKISVGDTIEIIRSNQKLSAKIKTIKIGENFVNSASKGAQCGVKTEEDFKFSRGDFIKIKKESNSVTQNTTDSSTQTSSNDNQKTESEFEKTKKAVDVSGLQSPNKENYLKIFENKKHAEEINEFINKIKDYSELNYKNDKSFFSSGKVKEWGLTNGFNDYVKDKGATMDANDTQMKNYFIKTIGPEGSIRKILKECGYDSSKPVNQFLGHYKLVNKNDDKIISWFFENHVNNHFTMKRIFNS